MYVISGLFTNFDNDSQNFSEIPLTLAHQLKMRKKKKRKKKTIENNFFYYHAWIRR